MLEVLLATVGVLALAVAATSRWLPRLPLSPPLLALVLGVALGPAGVGAVVIDAGRQPEVLAVAGELLLAVALMAVALRHPLASVRGLTGRLTLLLAVVMPAMAVSVAGVAGLTLGVPFAVAATIGACLAPTDPVLAAGVVTGGPAERDVPERLRELLSLESGANDGLALPLALGAGALLVDDSFWTGAGIGVLEVVIGLVVGGVLGVGAGKLLDLAERHHDIEDAARLLFTLMLALAVLGIVGLAGGNGLLGVFAAGLAHNATITDADRAPAADIDEEMNQFLVLPTFTLVGAVLPWSAWGELGWGGVGFVIGVLLLRRLPWVLVVARPLGLRAREAIWFGWFGPIGVAAVFYLAHLHELGRVDATVWSAGTLAVAVSTVVHGVTAPAGRALLRRSR